MVGSREAAILAYREYVLSKPELLAALDELTGKRLGCFCKPKPCHGDVLVDLWEVMHNELPESTKTGEGG